MHYITTLLFLCISTSLIAVSDPIYSPKMDLTLTLLELATIETSPTQPQNAEDWYELALQQIKKKEFSKARESLNHALHLQPDFFEAQLQLALIDMWENQNERAAKQLWHILNEYPCDRRALQALEDIALKWTNLPDKQKQAIAIYRYANRCDPDNPDLLFYLGRLTSRAGEWKEAKQLLKACLNLAPEYEDAAIQLARIYIWQKNYVEARHVLKPFPYSAEANILLGQIAMREGNPREATGYYRQSLKKNPHNRTAHRGLGHSLAAQMFYTDAHQEFSYIVDDDPNTEENWIPLFNIKEHTHFSAFLESNYTKAKENDPSLQQPVVKDYYFYNALHLMIPIADPVRLEITPIYYNQKEKDIYPPIGTNYDVDIAGGQITSSVFFPNGWQWNLFAREIRAWGVGTEFYPFQKTTRFEPGTNISYHSDRQLFVMDAHVESFIIKNFSNMTSELLRTDFLSATYRYRVASPLRPEIGATITHVIIHDNLNNWENTELVEGLIGLPKLAQYITAIYRFEHGHFHKLNINYYSFKQQYRNTLGLDVHMDIKARARIALIYEHQWQMTHNLFQPIGNDVFIADRQFLRANKITGQFSYRYKDMWRFNLESHYFRDTLPYRDLNFKGSLLIYF
ncbi:MAG: tetratricopeptide repeat protein [Simkaniaceae bacterium]|nr:tetratricopeptide repeat protein [Simkaniaceae bacterium]